MSDADQPSPNGANGRDGRGRFSQGNSGGPGNPHAAKVASLRAAILAAVTEDDIRQVVATLVTMAKGGDLPAIRELLLRTVGKPVESDLLERIDRLEATMTDGASEWT